MSMYLRDNKGFPGAAFAAVDINDGVIRFAVAAWNAKADSANFERQRARIIAEGRIAAGKFDGEVPKEGKYVRAILREIIEAKHEVVLFVTPAGKRIQSRPPGWENVKMEEVKGFVPKFPQRARLGAKLALERLENMPMKCLEDDEIEDVEDDREDEEDLELEEDDA